MGLLDEAIRDHLELKRRRGADPTEIARAEHEALEPVFPGEVPRGSEAEGPQPDLDDGEPTIPVEHAPHSEHAEETAPGDPVLEPILDDREPTGEPGAAPPAGSHEAIAADPAFSTLGQETAELDVEAYMEAEAQAPAHDASGAAARPAYDSDDELLEWEEPSARAAEPPPEQIPGQERLSLE